MTATDPSAPGLHVHTGTPDQLDVDLLGIPVYGVDDALADLGDLDGITAGEVGRARASGAFRVKRYETLLTRVVGTGWRARHLLFVGAGPLSELDAERQRRLAAVTSYVGRSRRTTSIGWLVRRAPALDAAVRAAADGLAAGEFEAGVYKREDEQVNWRPAAVTVLVPGGDGATLGRAADQGRVIAECVHEARRLQNEPGNVLPPRELARRIAESSAALGLGVEVLEEDRLRELGMRMLLGVGQGSVESPRLVVLRHDPPDAPSTPVIGLVGKGITFDTGGISLKPALEMDRMKYDMTGAAAVAAAMQAIARLGSKHRVVGVVALAENMPGGRALKPGDVLRAASGTTVEVLNTDAEGRLVLGDALWYARQIGATHLVDVATLTGAVVIALGHYTSAVLGRPEPWVSHVARCAAAGGDRVWPLPLYEEARDQLSSDVADFANIGGRPGGTVTAAAFLREFAGEGAWAHLDIAGTAWAETKTAYQPKGPTGVAVRALTELGMTGAPESPERRG